MAEDRGPIKAQLKDLFKVILRVTGLLLSCAVLFLSGFYLGIYQGDLVRIPEAGIITATYPPNSPDSSSSPYASDDDSNGQPGEELDGADAEIADGVPALASTAGPSTASPSPVAESPPSPEEVLAGLIWPVAGKITGEPGWVEQKDLKQWAYYSGVEISCEAGAPVAAALAGTVSEVEVDPLLGTVVTILHQSGLETSYGRILGVAKSPGDTVSQGDQIGVGGSDGIYFSIVSQGEPLRARECLAAAK